jgi:hypothetical protein
MSKNREFLIKWMNKDLAKLKAETEGAIIFAGEHVDNFTLDSDTAHGMRRYYQDECARIVRQCMLTIIAKEEGNPQ